MTLEPGLAVAFRYTVAEADTAPAIGSGEAHAAHLPPLTPGGLAAMNSTIEGWYQPPGMRRLSGRCYRLAVHRHPSYPLRSVLRNRGRSRGRA